jgi:hypothetical protein
MRVSSFFDQLGFSASEDLGILAMAVVGAGAGFLVQRVEGFPCESGVMGDMSILNFWYRMERSYR